MITLTRVDLEASFVQAHTGMTRAHIQKLAYISYYIFMTCINVNALHWQHEDVLKRTLAWLPLGFLSYISWSYADDTQMYLSLRPDDPMVSARISTGLVFLNCPHG